MPLTSFVGRERLAEIKRLLRSRLLTLTGTGGIGKTRLALEVASIAEAEFPGGVCVIELATLTDPALVAASVATAVGIGERPDQALTVWLPGEVGV